MIRVLLQIPTANAEVQPLYYIYKGKQLRRVRVCVDGAALTMTQNQKLMILFQVFFLLVFNGVAITPKIGYFYIFYIRV